MPNDATKPVEKEEEFTEATFEDVTSPLRGGGQISSEMIEYYADLGETDCEEEDIEKVGEAHIKSLKEKQDALRFLVGASDMPEYQRLSNRIQTIKKKTKLLVEKLKKHRSISEESSFAIKSMAQAAGHRKPVSKHAMYTAMEKIINLNRKKQGK